MTKMFNICLLIKVGHFYSSPVAPSPTLFPRNYSTVKLRETPCRLRDSLLIFLAASLLSLFFLAFGFG